MCRLVFVDRAARVHAPHASALEPRVENRPPLKASELILIAVMESAETRLYSPIEEIIIIYVVGGLQPMEDSGRCSCPWVFLFD